MIAAFSKAYREDTVTHMTAGGLTTFPFLNDYVPGPGMDSTSFVLADDSVTLHIAGNNPPRSSASYAGPVLNDAGEETLVPTGGGIIATVSDGASLPATVYGFVICSDSLGTDPLYAGRYDEPIDLNVAGQVVFLPQSIALANACGGVGNI